MLRRCSACKTEKPLDEYHRNRTDAFGRQSMCKDCKLTYVSKTNPKHNPHRMYVNGKYVPKSHPLHKPGRYTTYDDAWSFQEMDEKCPSGHVYLIGNEAWPGWVKCGMAVDVQDRLKGYQTSSPHRDYFVLAHWEAVDRRKAEREAHQALASIADEQKGEWFFLGVDRAREYAIICERMGN